MWWSIFGCACARAGPAGDCAAMGNALYHPTKHEGGTEQQFKQVRVDTRPIPQGQPTEKEGIDSRGKRGQTFRRRRRAPWGARGEVRAATHRSSHPEASTCPLDDALRSLLHTWHRLLLLNPNPTARPIVETLRQPPLPKFKSTPSHSTSSIFTDVLQELFFRS